MHLSFSYVRVYLNNSKNTFILIPSMEAINLLKIPEPSTITVALYNKLPKHKSLRGQWHLSYSIPFKTGPKIWMNFFPRRYINIHMLYPSLQYGLHRCPAFGPILCKIFAYYFHLNHQCNIYCLYLCQSSVSWCSVISETSYLTLNSSSHYQTQV